MWEAATGKPVNFPFGKRALVVSQWPDTLLPKPAPLWERAGRHDLGPREAGLNLLGLAVVGDTLYVALNLQDKVVAYNWRTGEKVREYPVPSPVGLAPGGLEVVAVNGYFGQFNLLAQNGMWVTALCKDNRYGPKADATTVWPENFSGWFFRHPHTGKFYLIAGDTDVRIWEVTGLDTVRTADTPLTLTEADRDRAILAAAHRQGRVLSRAPLVIPKVTAPVTVDGDLADWDLSHSVTLDAGGGRSAQVALARDDRCLFVAFRVKKDGPLRNRGDDFGLLFKTGDACEVFLATDPSAPQGRTGPTPGDLRLLFSVLGGKPVCVLYQPALQGGTRAPRMFSSPVSAEPFDRVVLLTDAQVAVTGGADGYVLEAAVPLADLGFSPTPGMLTRGDVGVIFSDPGGSRNVLRVDWANKDTAIVNDIPTEARLEPAKWGEVKVE